MCVCKVLAYFVGHCLLTMKRDAKLGDSRALFYLFTLSFINFQCDKTSITPAEETFCGSRGWVGWWYPSCGQMALEFQSPETSKRRLKANNM